MIDKEKLKEIMGFIIKEYPEGCANHNWINSNYMDIVKNVANIEDYEVENIVEECMNEFTEDLGLCGCGCPEKTIEVIRLVLSAQNEDEWDNKTLTLNNICNLDVYSNKNYDGLIQFVLYILDNHGFLEHGGSIGGAWLTKKGELFLELLNMNKELENNNLE